MSQPSSGNRKIPRPSTEATRVHKADEKPQPQNLASLTSDELPTHQLSQLPTHPSSLGIRQRTVQRMQQSHGNRAVRNTIHNDEENEDISATANSIPQQLESTRGHGSRLDQDIRMQLENQLNADLSSVRVHTDPQADVLAEELHAKAFTTGQDIYFRSSNYAPATDQGMRLLTHETVHAVQQQNGAVAGVSTQEGIRISHPDDPFERQAEQVSHQMGNLAIDQRLPDSMIQRDGEDDSQTAKALEESADTSQLETAVKVEQVTKGIDNVKDIDQAKTLLNQVTAATSTLDQYMGQKGWGSYLTNQHKVDNQNAAQNLDMFLTYAGEETRTSNDFKTRYSMVKQRFSRLDAMANEWMSMYDADMRTPEDFVKTETGLDAQGAGKQSAELTARSKGEPTSAVEARAARARVKDLRVTASTQNTLLNSFDDGARSSNLKVIAAANRIEAAAQASKAKPEEADSPQVAEVKKKMADVKAKMSAGVSVAKVIPGAGKYIEGVESAASATSKAADVTGLDVDLTKIPDMILTDIYRADLENAQSAQNTARAAAETAGSIANTADLQAALTDKVSASKSRMEIADQLNTTLTSLREAINTLGRMLDETYETKKGGGAVGGGYELIAKFLSESDTCLYEAGMAIHAGQLQKDSATQSEEKRKVTLADKNNRYHRVEPVAERFEIITKHIAIISSGSGSSGGEGGMTETIQKMITEVEAGKKIVEAYQKQFNQALGL